ncbi:MAG: GNAT family N-acetyltransferase [Bdellovibrionia bacterium]
MSPVHLKKLEDGQHHDVSELQRVLESAPLYWKRIANKTIESDGAQSVLQALPEGKTRADKYVLGIYLPNQSSEQMIGCIDLIRGFPDSQTAMLGLLIVSESYQKQGLGKASYEALEKVIRSWPEMRKVRIGVIEANGIVLPFWKSLGFVETGVRRPYEDNGVVSENIVLEKSLK